MPNVDLRKAAAFPDKTYLFTRAPVLSAFIWQCQWNVRSICDVQRPATRGLITLLFSYKNRALIRRPARFEGHENESESIVSSEAATQIVPR